MTARVASDPHVVSFDFSYIAMQDHIWINELDQPRGKNISAVAVANKNARIAWALLTKKQCYEAAII